MSEKILLFRDAKKSYYRDGNRFIKTFDQSYSKANIFNEVLNHTRVEETGLNIPKIYGVNVAEGERAIEMEYVEGETLESLMSKNPEKTDEYLDRFIDLQCEIHSKRCLFLTKFKDKMTSRIMASDLDASTRYDLCIRLNAMPMHNHLCHGDFNPSNVIITGSGEACIIDWAHASQGNATADAAKTYLIFLVNGKEDLAERYVEAYCKKTGTPRSYVEDWIPLVAAAQIVKVSGEKKRKMTSFIN